MSKRRYVLHWLDDAKAVGRTLNASQRDDVIRQAEALRNDPYVWMNQHTARGKSKEGRNTWRIPGANIQLYFYVENGEVWVYNIGTEDIPPLEERD